MSQEFSNINENVLMCLTIHYVIWAFSLSRVSSPCH